MAYVYRRPFDYSSPRRLPQIWWDRALFNAQAGSGAFATYAAVVSSGGVASENPSRAVRFSAKGIFRRRWPYAVNNARQILFYTDAQETQGVAASGSFATNAATVQLGSTSGAAIVATDAASAFDTYTSEVTGARQDPIGDNTAVFSTYAAAVIGTEGLGESRVGGVPAKGRGGYLPGRLSVKGRTGRKLSPMRELVKRK